MNNNPTLQSLLKYVEGSSPFGPAH